MPAENGSKVFIIYKPSSDSVAINVESEHPLHIPAPHVPPHNGQNFTVDIWLAVLFGQRHPSLMNGSATIEQLELIIFVIDKDSFQKAGEFKKPYLKQVMDDSFVTVEVWTHWLETDIQVC